MFHALSYHYGAEINNMPICLSTCQIRHMRIENFAPLHLRTVGVWCLSHICSFSHRCTVLKNYETDGRRHCFIHNESCMHML